jgi:protein phosphatase 1G
VPFSFSVQALLELDPSSRAAYFAVFDGHGGKEVAKYCAAHLHTAFAAHPAFAAGQVEDALVAAFMQMDTQIVTDVGRRLLAGYAEEGLAQGDGSAGRDRAMLAGDEMDDEGTGMHAGPSAGCTSVVAVLKGSMLYVANAGDSRAVLCRAGVAQDLSIDHKPTLDGEKARILAAGGFVADGRVKGSLALSRAIGDMEFKQANNLPPEQQMVTALPEVQSVRLSAGDEFLILACDGIWDVMSSQQAVDFVRRQLEAGASPSAVCEALCDHCCARDTRGSGLGCDNMSVIVVQFKATALAAH